ncbi:hypothetical protein SAMN05421688_0804 [Poseidonocella pacifica]|uniref:Sulfotransferase family protein n=1 Tax=Poseidonocella pacifica TaxID=871651 RepID=A0A1I0VP61_9RHOB|nr:sulfotransferase family 2 domain-containing protein [Poseidonocella pacifica]SFA77797.1 hypothetical protein SAMN05421688_0804 [Poseidonocella pacifica]
MLIFFDANLVFFAVPKTGTTAYESALRKRADIVYRNKPAVKHLNTRKFDRSLAPYLKKAHQLVPERLAMIREPLDQLGSWYRYRTLLPTSNPNSTKGHSFDAFLRAHLLDRPPAFAKIGRQHTFLTDPDGAIRVHHLFAADRGDLVHAFLEARFGEPVEIGRRNLSPSMEISCDPGLAAEVRAARAADFELYESVSRTGYLQFDLDESPSRKRR